MATIDTGHHIAEEAPQELAELLSAFLGGTLTGVAAEQARAGDR
jgi:hypothetical protein